MAVIFFRTLIVYMILLLVLRLTGKRQIGELQPSELVTTLILSQLASQPIVDDNIPVAFGLIPVFVVVCLEVIASYVVTKNAFIKRVFVGKPSILINRGKLDVKELSRVRVTVEELMSELRSRGVGDISDVYYAVMEENGSISVLLKSSEQPPSKSDMSIAQKERGMAKQIVSGGKINIENLNASGKNEAWLKKLLSDEGLELKDVFLLTCNDASETLIIKNQAEKKKAGKTK